MADNIKYSFRPNCNLLFDKQSVDTLERRVMHIKMLLGLALFAAALILIILYAVHVDNFDTTVANILAAIASYIGVSNALNQQTSHQP
jgi:hypothetical protein